MTQTSDWQKMQLELGGSVFELIEFTLTRRIGGKMVKGTYGVNVAKVREVVRLPKINPLAARVPGLAGIFELRGVPIPAVHLTVALGDEPSEPVPTQQIIVTEFSGKRAGFIVDATRRIRRIAWDKVLPPSSDLGSFMSGMTLIENSEFLFILDLERMLMHLESLSLGGSGHSGYAAEQHLDASLRQVTPSVAPKGGAGTILLVDDSQFIRSSVKQVMQKVGFKIFEASDGVEALQVLERTPGIDLVVCDVEMPRMNGLAFTKAVREHARLGELPVLLHTSLSGRVSQQAGMLAGANGYVIKNDFRALFELIKEILGRDIGQALSA